MPLVLRSVKGSKLTISEMDGNLVYLESLALSGTTGSTRPAGSNSQVQYNDIGSFGADASFSFDAIQKSLSVPAVSTQTVAASEGVSAAFFSNPSTVTSNQTVPPGHNAMMIGPDITVAQGVVVTVSEGSVLTVVSGGSMPA